MREPAKALVGYPRPSGERQLVLVADRQAVPAIEVRQAPVASVAEEIAVPRISIQLVLE